MLLDELSNAELIKRIKYNTTDNSPLIAEIDKRLTNDELSDKDLIELFDVLTAIKTGGDKFGFSIKIKK